MTTSLVFFSGGSALGNIARYLARNNISSSHLITTFDNGGSSGKLRECFQMPAVGDLRNRMLALASPDCSGELLRFLKLRLNPLPDARILARQFALLASPSNYNWRKMPAQAVPALREALDVFCRACPEGFNFAKASIGNIILAGLYLAHNRDLLAALAKFSNMLHIKGQIAPVSLENLHLGAHLANGETILGQEKFESIASPITEIFFSKSLSRDSFSALRRQNFHRPRLAPEAEKLLNAANLICYPPGSFYSSILVNLLVEGVGKLVAKSPAIKVMTSNSGYDPEEHCLGIAGQVEVILKTLKMDQDAPASSFLNYVLVDLENGQYVGDAASDCQKLEKMGIKVIDANIVSPAYPDRHMPKPLVSLLLKLAGD